MAFPSPTDRWTHEFNRVIKRFRHILVLQLFGHTHFDEFRLFPFANSMSFLAPSLTPHEGINPGYKIYRVDPQNWHLKDLDTYFYDLERALREEKAMKPIRDFHIEEYRLIKHN